MPNKQQARSNTVDRIREALGLEPQGELASDEATFLNYPAFMIEINNTEVNLLLNLKHELFSDAMNMAVVTDIVGSEASQAGYDGCQVQDMNEE
jgi:hypothetical protein